MYPVEVNVLTKVYPFPQVYGSRCAVDGLSMKVAKGRITALVGPDGAGKSTVCRILLGLAAPTSGSALVFGQRYQDLVRPVHQVGGLVNRGGAHPGRTGAAHLRALQLAGRLPLSRIEEVLTVVGLVDAAGVKVASYSRGMRERLGLASALLGEPDLLILDEPDSGLDPAGADWLRGCLRAYADAGGTVLIAAHVLSELAQQSDDLVVLHHGRSLAAGTTAEVTGGRTVEKTCLDLTSDSAARKASRAS